MGQCCIQKVRFKPRQGPDFLFFMAFDISTRILRECLHVSCSQTVAIAAIITEQKGHVSFVLEESKKQVSTTHFPHPRTTFVVAKQTHFYLALHALRSGQESTAVSAPDTHWIKWLLNLWGRSHLRNQTLNWRLPKRKRGRTWTRLQAKIIPECD